MTIADILKSLAERQTGTRWGIGTAAFYLKSFAGVDPALVGMDPEQWSLQLKEAAGRLTYCDEQMGDTDALTKSINEGTGIGDGVRMVFDCVLTSKNKDRDGDILEPKGMRVDPKMPLLWQHNQLQPIGAHKGVVAVNDEVIRSKFTILDTELGRDAATLVKGGALRISQGFKPSEFSPLEIVKNAEGKDVVRGWHVKQGDIMEGSLVSIPANTDAVITAYVQKQFEAPLVREWARKFYEARPVQVQSGIDLTVKADGEINVKRTDMPGKHVHDPRPDDANGRPPQLDQPPNSPWRKALGELDLAELELETKEGKVLSAANIAKVRAAIEALQAVLNAAEPKSTTPAGRGMSGMDVVVSAMAAGGKSFDGLRTKAVELQTKMMGDAVGSYEWVRETLRQSLGSFLKSAGVSRSDKGYGHVEATYPDHAVVMWEHFDDKHSDGMDTPPHPSFSKYYRINWKMSDGRPEWTGTPVEVEQKTTWSEKDFHDLLTKAAESLQLRQKDGNGQIVPQVESWPETLEQITRKFVAKAIEIGGDEADVAVSVIQDLQDHLRKQQDARELNTFMGTTAE